jgi:PAS domain S-box-containing protein
MANQDAVKNSKLISFRGPGGYGRCSIIGTIALMVLTAGLWISKQSGEFADLKMRRELVQQVSNIAAAVNPENIRRLSFTAADKDCPVYQLLCDQLAAYAEATGVRSLYTMALRDEQIVFGPESLPGGDPYASPPGTVFQEPTQRDFDLFRTAQPQIQGPVSDEYGTFVSASAPIVDRITGKVLAAVGIDVEAQEWKATVRRAQWIPGGITLGLVAFLFLCGLILRFRQHLPGERARRLRHAEPVFSAGFMLALTVALVFHFNRVERSTRRSTFYSIAQAKAAASTAQFHDMNLKLEQLAIFFESSDWVSREDFRTYCRNILQAGTIDGCVWVPAIPMASVAAFVQTVRSEGVPGFFIWQKSAEGLREPVPVRPVYAPILYIEPTRSKEIQGYDELSDPVRAAAIHRALSTGLGSATDPVVLIQAPDPQPAFLVFKSVEAMHQKGVVGFAVLPKTLLGTVFQGTTKGDLEVCLFQLRHGEEPFLLAGSLPHCGRGGWPENESGMSLTVPFFRFGKTYALHLTPDDDWLAAHPLRSGRQAGWAGALITVLISSLVGLITTRRIELEKLVEQRTGELQASEQLFEGVLNTIPVRVFWKDKNLVCRGCNKEFANDVGLASPQDIEGKDDYQLGRREQAERYRADDRQVIESGQSKLMIEEPLITPNGKILTLLTNKIPLRDENGELCGVLGTYLDITERKQAEDALRKTKNLLLETGKMGNVGAWEFNIETGEQVWTEEVYCIHEVDHTLHPTVEKGIGFYAPESRPVIERAIQRVIELGEPYDLELEIITAKGNRRNVHTIGRLDPARRKIFGFFQDITERKQAEQRIHQLARHLETVREEERKRLSRELHDDIGQILTALKIDLVVVEDQCSCNDEVHKKMGDMRKLLSNGIQSVHALCRRLRPGALDDLSLADALEGLIDDWQQRNQIQCTLSADLDDAELSDEIKTAVFRMVQEALTNVSRYAGASCVRIGLVSGGQTLTVWVGDDGCGMALGAAGKAISFGLMGMHERIEALGGTLQIDSTPGQGTRLEAVLPLPQNG